jgi:hypothetical protein
VEEERRCSCPQRRARWSGLRMRHRQQLEDDGGQPLCTKPPSLTHPEPVSLVRARGHRRRSPHSWPFDVPCTSDMPWRYASLRSTSPALARMSREATLAPSDLISERHRARTQGRAGTQPRAESREPRQGDEERPWTTRPLRFSCTAALAAHTDLTASSSPEAT